MLSEEQIKGTSELLGMVLNEERMTELKDTYEDWMKRAKRLDKKMSSYGLFVLPAANVFIH